ncbi:glycosyltransferase family 2 protein [Vibrio hangzhouensis]|uniref:Glycosyltransferase, GT2 family n=1 Tax=Vibrio hangzhouensis TaxID=462991 RepID=A0A1H6BZ41_9VIBR|nr:glycosyltransferase family 2 protein [Vibrio hangzhouensis]SEG65979.1 Glycosyltransferase, GT2 family [Vibrio hangzhouensis]
MFNLLLINYYSWDEVYRIVNDFHSSDMISKIVIVDNSHETNQLSRFNTFLDKLVIVSALNNSGYSGGNNIGFWALSKNKVTGDIIISNGDINISPAVVDYASNIFCTNNDIGQLYFETYDNEGRLMYNTIHLNGLLQKWNITDNRTELSSSDYAAGSFFVIRRSIVDLFERIFDERYFMYWEEVELSLNVRALGYRVVCSERYHLIRDNNSHAAVTNSIYYIVRNSFMIKEKIKVSFLNNLIFFLKMLITTVKLSVMTRKLRPISLFTLGFFHGLKGKSGKNEQIHK